MNITIEFDASNDIPEVEAKGNASILEGIFDHLPEPENLNWETSVGTIVLKKI